MLRSLFRLSSLLLALLLHIHYDFFEAPIVCLSFLAGEDINLSHILLLEPLYFRISRIFLDGRDVTEEVPLLFFSAALI